MKNSCSTAIFSQRDGRTPAEIRRRKNNRQSCFISRAEKQTQRRNGRTPAEIRLKKNARPSFFFRRHLKLPQRRNGRTPAEIRSRKNNRPSCFISRAEKQTQRRDGRNAPFFRCDRYTVAENSSLDRYTFSKKRANTRRNQEKAK